MSEKITYRFVRDEDLPVIARMYELLESMFHQMGYMLPTPDDVQTLWLESFRRTLGKFSQVWIAEKDGKVVGFMLARLKMLPAFRGGMMVGELSDMFIDPGARRLGIGEQLSEQAINWLKEKGAHSIEIQVLAGNEPSWKLYEKMGFQLEFRAGRKVL